jgi:hypothetical protein
VREGSGELYLDWVDGVMRSPRGLFAPVPRPALAGTGTSVSGLVLPGIPSTAWMLGLTPVAEGHGWPDNVVRVYLVARDYLAPFEAARGRGFDREAWIRVLLGLYPAEEYLCQLAILNHAATRDELTQPVQDRYLACMRPEAAGALRRALAGGVDGQRRWFLTRQLVLRAMRLVLLPPEAAAQVSPDPVLEADLAGVISPETAAVLLVHLVGDALYGEVRDGGPRLCGIPEPVAMEMIANNLFYDRDDVGDLLARYRMLWLDYGNAPRSGRHRAGRDDHPGVHVLVVPAGPHAGRPAAGQSHGRPRHDDQPGRGRDVPRPVLRHARRPGGRAAQVPAGLADAAAPGPPAAPPR